MSHYDVRLPLTMRLQALRMRPLDLCVEWSQKQLHIWNLRSHLPIHYTTLMGYHHTMPINGSLQLRFIPLGVVFGRKKTSPVLGKILAFRGGR